MTLIKVFPRKTRATPDDVYAFVGSPPKKISMDIEEIHVSVTYTYDMGEAERLFKEWEQVCSNIKIGGPALDDPGGDFIPGKYVKKGYVITSRGCPNKCWFCYVWKREGKIRELPIKNGWNVLDSNLLACGEDHIRKVFMMLDLQRSQYIRFTGGLEAARLENWHIDLFSNMRRRPDALYFAYDTPDDYEPLVEAGRKFKRIGWGIPNKYNLYCFILCGWKSDTITAAEKRVLQAINAGFIPFAMLYRDKNGRVQISKEWNEFKRNWESPFMATRNIRKILDRGDFKRL